MRKRHYWQSRFSGSARPANAQRKKHGLRVLGNRGFEMLEDRAMLASGVLATYTLINDWGSGYQGQIQLANQQTASVPNWRRSSTWRQHHLDLGRHDVSHTGNHYVIQGAAWDSSIAGRANVTFGFVASGGEIWRHRITS